MTPPPTYKNIAETIAPCIRYTKNAANRQFEAVSYDLHQAALAMAKENYDTAHSFFFSASYTAEVAATILHEYAAALRLYSTLLQFQDEPEREDL